MPTRRTPRKGSLQYWPRKRASKILPRVNWNIIDSSKILKGFIGYKAGMVSGFVKDETEHSMTKGRKIIIPMTVIECPPIKIFSVRFYKNNQVVKEILAENLDKELKRKVKLPKEKKKLPEINVSDYEKISVIVYSIVKKTGLKKKPDLAEIGLKGSVEEQWNFVKGNINKEIFVSDSFDKNELVDVRGLTKGKGFQGPVKRFGIKLRFHKTEKGRRKVGSIGPWHPARVTFRVPMAGQLGMFTRVIYNNKIIEVAKSSEKPIKDLKNYGNVNSDYILVRGSVQGPAKRPLLLSHTVRETKRQKKKNFELLEVRR